MASGQFKQKILYDLPFYFGNTSQACDLFTYFLKLFIISSDLSRLFKVVKVNLTLKVLKKS